MNLTGKLLIGREELTGSGQTFQAIDPSTGEKVAPLFFSGTVSDVDAACNKAAAAFDTYRDTTPEQRAAFLDKIAEEIEQLGEALIIRASTETGLPHARLEGERARTVGQLRMFAQLLRDGSWTEARIVSADPSRQPLPKPELRQRHIAIGPVAVFGASNFPLAYSVAGGDTASALAAGCPVVVKGHQAHPGTSELVARSVRKAVEACGLPEGVFSLLQSSNREVGAALVAHPEIKSVGFTGSYGGGTALMRIAASRPEPIPVHAEMGSVNPVFLLPGALSKSADRIAEDFIVSLTASAGQFCTNPGMVIGIAGDDLDRFTSVASEILGKQSAPPMLTPTIHASYVSGVDTRSQHPDVTVFGRGSGDVAPHGCNPALFGIEAHVLAQHPHLAEENFGSSSVVVKCQSIDEMMAIAGQLEGQLTATLHCEGSGDSTLAKSLLTTLERKAGRIIFNGWPTGVEVNAAIVHGGPFPASSDGRTTSVGPLAIRRFLRPVCYQNFPNDLLPAALSDDNPWNIPQQRTDN